MTLRKQRAVAEMTRALFDSDLIATRLLLAFSEMCWAIMLLWPGDTFERQTYALMGQIAPEPCWAAAFLVTAIVQYRIVSQGWHATKAAWWFSVWNSLLWVAAIGLMIKSVYPPPAAISGEVGMMVGALWICVRPLVNKLGERKHAAKFAAR